ncbi:MAG: triose-phosphate isomerase, partial [Rhizobacter sp.]|nr:triose-phosphate isomerase [Rhizobacter sp.]
MNGSVAANAALLDALKAASLGNVEVSVCVPAPYLRDVATTLAKTAIGWGGQ